VCGCVLGFAAVDLTVACMMEVMWTMVLQDYSLLEVVLQYTNQFLLAPVSPRQDLSLASDMQHKVSGLLSEETIT